MKLLLAGFAALAVCLVAVGRPATDGKVTVAVVKYDGLTDLIKKNKGKVLVLDFWADYCIPCKREFPKLVALNQKHSKDSFVAFSVSLDDLSDTDSPRFHQCRVRLNLDCFGNLTDFQYCVQSRIIVNLQHQSGLDVRAKSG